MLQRRVWGLSLTPACLLLDLGVELELRKPHLMLTDMHTNARGKRSSAPPRGHHTSFLVDISCEWLLLHRASNVTASPSWPGISLGSARRSRCSIMDRECCTLREFHV